MSNKIWLKECFEENKLLFWTMKITDERVLFDLFLTPISPNIVENPERVRLRNLILNNIFANNAKAAYFYSYKLLQKQWGPGEQIISTDSYYAFAYITDVVEGPWKMGESAIARRSDIAFLYACDVIKERFPEGETKISSDSRIKELYEKKFNCIL